MPVKKKKSVKKKFPEIGLNVDEGIKKEIEQLASSIPKLIAKGVESGDYEKRTRSLEHFAPKEPRKINRPPIDRAVKQKKRLMWSGVIIFTSVVLIMWMWNASSLFYDLKANPSPEEKFWDKTKKDFSAIFSEIDTLGKDELSQAIQKNTDTTNIQEALSALATTIILTNTVATTTTTTAVSTTTSTPSTQLTDPPNE